MIQLHRDYLVIETSSGQAIPCSAEMITVELMGEYASLLDPEIVQQSAAAVLHYFKHELAQEFVSVSEFSAALAKALKSFGLTVEPAEPPPAPSRVLRSDLRKLALVADKGSALFFFLSCARNCAPGSMNHPRSSGSMACGLCQTIDRRQALEQSLPGTE